MMSEFRRQLTTLDSLHRVTSDFQKTILLLQALKSGAVHLDEIAVSDTGWQIIEIQNAPPPKQDDAASQTQPAVENMKTP